MEKTDILADIRNELPANLIAEHCFAAPLTHVGLTASSHDAGPLRLLFVDLRRDPGGPLAAADLTVTPLGQAAGAVQDGL